jgi:organic hydroperoxide reductase OsmC/OhrA
MRRSHHYEVAVTWTGNRGDGTATYRSYGREHEVVVEGKPLLVGSSDPMFHGDRDRWNPEELLTAALAQCHMLAYLHACAANGVVVTEYRDDAIGTMVDHGLEGEFVEVVLRPSVTVTSAEAVDVAEALHDEAHRVCFIARSVNFPVRHEPTIRVDAEA